jgi:DNA polymerase-1
MGWQVLWEKETEADDLLYTMALRARENQDELWIASGDKDVAQCLFSPKIRLLRPPKKSSEPWLQLDSENVQSLFGVAPEQIADYLALTGDTCDNLPGVSGAGPKTVLKWMTQYGSLAAIVQNKETLQPARLREKIEAEQLARNLVVTTGIDTGHQIPPAGTRMENAVEALKDMGLHKVAQRLA